MAGIALSAVTAEVGGVRGTGLVISAGAVGCLLGGAFYPVVVG
jgi:hypothetical protein